MSELSDSGFVKNQAIQSSKWALVARTSQILGGAILMILLPFWITPNDFGIITLITSILALAVIVQQAGLAEATIQQDKNAKGMRDAAFWLSVFFSVILYLILFLLAPLVGDFFHYPRLIPVLRIMALQIVLLGYSNIPLAWMQREFKYRLYAGIQAFSSLVMIFIALFFSIRGDGYWGYVAGTLGGAVVRCGLVTLFADWRPRFVINSLYWKRASRFGGFVLVEMLLGWLLVWFDNIVVARHLGNNAAGIYALAFSIAIVPISLPISAITGVALSTFSRMQTDLESLRNAYIRGTGLIVSYSIPAGIGLSLVGPLVLEIIYPGRWSNLSLILPVLALYSGFGHLWILNTDAFKAINEPQTMLKIYIPVVAIMLPLYWWSSQIGLLEFALVRSLVVIVGAIPHTYFAIRYLGLSRTYLLELIRAPLLASSIMAVGIFLGIKLVPEIANMAAGFRLVYTMLLMGMGALVYIFSMEKISPGFFGQISSLYLRLIDKTS